MNTITEKKESVVRNSAAETIVNTGMRNSRSGRIGSAARRSRTIQAPSSATRGRAQAERSRPSPRRTPGRPRS